MTDLEVLQEPARLDALRRLALANLEPEEPFDRLTRLAAFICAAPTALLTFVSQRHRALQERDGAPGRPGGLAADLARLFHLPVRRRHSEAARGAGHEKRSRASHQPGGDRARRRRLRRGATPHLRGAVPRHHLGARLEAAGVDRRAGRHAPGSRRHRRHRARAPPGADRPRPHRGRAAGERDPIPLAHRADVRHHHDRGRERRGPLRQPFGRDRPRLRSRGAGRPEGGRSGASRRHGPPPGGAPGGAPRSLVGAAGRGVPLPAQGRHLAGARGAGQRAPVPVGRAPGGAHAARRHRPPARPRRRCATARSGSGSRSTPASAGSGTGTSPPIG